MGAPRAGGGRTRRVWDGVGATPGERALAREVIVADLAAAIENAAADLVARRTLALVRQDRLADYCVFARQNAADWVEAGMPVYDGALPVPPDMCADPSLPDVRFSVSVRRAMQDIAQGRDSTALENAKYGTITYPVGKLGKGGMGFLHIVEQRMWKDGATFSEAIDTAIDVATAAEIGDETEHRHNTHHLDYNGTRAIVGVMPDKSIVITGYEIKTDESVVAKQRAAELAPRPHVRSEEVIRALKEKLASTPSSIPYPPAHVNARYAQNQNASSGVWGNIPLVAPAGETPAQCAAVFRPPFEAAGRRFPKKESGFPMAA